MPNLGGAVVALEEARQGRNAGECWPWPRYVMKATGYGQTSYEGVPWLAHRLAYVLAYGPLPAGAVLDHACHTRMREKCVRGAGCPHRRCVNPAHLRVTDRAGNALAGNSPLSDNARKTHCIHGHELAGANLRIITRKGRKPSRECVECRRAANRKSYVRNDDAAKQRKRYAARKADQRAALEAAEVMAVTATPLSSRSC